MGRRQGILCLSAVVLVLAACGGNETPPNNDQDANGGDPPDAGAPRDGQPPGVDGNTPPPPPPPPPDAGPPPPQEVTITGQVTKLGAYLAGTTEPVSEASVLMYGVNPAQTAVADTTGNFSVVAPANGQVVMFANKAGYFPTYTEVKTAQVNIDNQRVYSTEVAWLNAIAAQHNVDLNAPFACHEAPNGGLSAGQQCIYGVIVGRVLDDGAAGNGTKRPVGGIGQADFSVTSNGATWYKKGPYFLNVDGTPSASTTSVVEQDQAGNYKGGLFVLFIELLQLEGPPATDVQLTISYNGRAFGPSLVKVFRPYGVTWNNVYETGALPPPPVGQIDFDTQIYPMFLPVNQGGFGCQGCHTNQGGGAPAAGMNLFGGPEAAYASLNPAMYPQRVNTGAPDDSYLLKRPLYEPDGVQDHPIFAFASRQDPGYVLIRQWISEGGLRNVAPPVIAFSTDVRNLLTKPTAEGGAGCYTCHVNGVNDRTAPAGFYMGGTAGQLLYQLTGKKPGDNGGTGERYRVNRDYPELSLLLINPLNGNPEPHPVKIFSGVTDPRYVLLNQWIASGALDDRASPDQVTAGQFVAQPGYEYVRATGVMVRNARPGTTSVFVQASGLTAGALYPVHVHARPCADNVGGGHYKIDPNGPDNDPANEIWAPITAGPSGDGNGYGTANIVAGVEAVSIVIHDPNAGNAKMACADLAPNADVLSEGIFVPVDPTTAPVAYGSATLRRFAGGTEVVVRMRGAGLQPNKRYPVHVHAEACEPNDGGGHYKIDTTIAGTEATNEIWPSMYVNANRVGWGEAFVQHIARHDAWSVVVHDPDTTPPAKLFCADLRAVNAANHGGKVANDVFTYGRFRAIDPNVPFTGKAGLVRTEDGQTSAFVEVSGLTPNTTYNSHVHVGSCAQALGHYYIDPALGAGEANEIWPSFTTDANGIGVGYALAAHYARPEAASIVVHNPVDNARLACADLLIGADVGSTGSFIELAAGAGSGITGTATLRRFSSGGTEVQISAAGLTPNTIYPVHVHIQSCANGEAGPHYEIDPAIEGVIATNEIWPDVYADAAGMGTGKAYVGHVARHDAVSVVIHDPVTRVKLMCADLKM